MELRVRRREPPHAATDPAGVETTYGYDQAGNRTSVKIEPAPEITTTFDTAGHPVSSSDGRTFTNDAWGRLTKVVSGGHTMNYSFDTWGRLTSAEGTLGIPSVTYTHDALDRTVSRQNATTGLSTYEYVGTSEQVARVVDAGTETLYSWSPGGQLSQKRPFSLRRVITDLHQDVVGVADATTGALLGTAAFGAWGERRVGAGDGSCTRASRER